VSIYLAVLLIGDTPFQLTSSVTTFFTPNTHLTSSFLLRKENWTKILEANELTNSTRMKRARSRSWTRHHSAVRDERHNHSAAKAQIHGRAPTYLQNLVANKANRWFTIKSSGQHLLQRPVFKTLATPWDIVLLMQLLHHFMEQLRGYLFQHRVISAKSAKNERFWTVWLSIFALD